MGSGPWLSVIIPCWNDAEALARILAVFQALPQPEERELIVADASEGPACAALAESLGARVVRCARPNRGGQMNAGAAAAGGEILLFQHADTEFSAAHWESLRATRTDAALLGGAFHRKFDERHPHLRWLERFHRTLSARFGATIYGDQSFFVRRAHFEALGHFRDFPLMEDMEFSKRLRRAGGVRLLDPPIATSARRALRQGAWKTSIQNGAFILLYKCGVSPVTLHRWYYGRNGKASADKLGQGN